MMKPCPHYDHRAQVKTKLDQIVALCGYYEDRGDQAAAIEALELMIEVGEMLKEKEANDEKG